MANIKAVYVSPLLTLYNYGELIKLFTGIIQPGCIHINIQLCKYDSVIGLATQ